MRTATLTVAQSHCYRRSDDAAAAAEQSSRPPSPVPVPVPVAKSTYEKHCGNRYQFIVPAIGTGMQSRIYRVELKPRQNTRATATTTQQQQHQWVPTPNLVCKVINLGDRAGDFHDPSERYMYVRNELLACTVLRDHPHILSLYEHSTSPDQKLWYLFFEFAPRKTLLEYVQQAWRNVRHANTTAATAAAAAASTTAPSGIALRTVEYMFAQLLSAVEFTHDMEIAHRDIKLENVLLFDDDRVKLGDWGLSSPLTPDAPLRHKHVGSPEYAAPEMLVGRNPYDAKKSDIWSLGALLYAIAIGKMAFQKSKDKHATVRAILDGQYETPQSAVQVVPHIFELLKNHMLVLAPENRSSATQIRTQCSWVARYFRTDHTLPVAPSQQFEFPAADDIYAPSSSASSQSSIASVGSTGGTHLLSAAAFDSAPDVSTE